MNIVTPITKRIRSLMKRVYIAGPFSANTPAGIKDNIDNAIAIGVMVVETRSGWFPIVPHTMTKEIWERTTAELQDPANKYWYDATMSELLTCDAALFLPGWEASKGCQAEKLLCDQYKIPYVMLKGDETIDRIHDSLTMFKWLI